MKKIIIYIIISLCGGLIFISCEQDLNRVPFDEMTENIFFKSGKDFKLYTNQFYYRIPDFSAISDKGDLTFQTGGNSISNGTYIAPEVDKTWDECYQYIRSGLILLEHAGNIESNDPIKDEIAVYIAETKFFIALEYFKLAVKFGGVPIIKEVLTLDSPELYNPRNTQAEVMDHIRILLEEAIVDLPLQSQLVTEDNGRITKGAAQALLARVALYEGTWRKFHLQDNGNAYLTLARDMAKMVMESNEYELFDRRDVLGDDSYRHMFILQRLQTNIANLTSEDNKEFILVYKRDEDINPGGGAFICQNYGDYIMSPTKKMADMFLCEDGLPIDKSPLFEGYETITSEYQHRDPRMTQVLVVPFTTFWRSRLNNWNRDWTKPYEGGVVFDLQFGSRTQTGYVTKKLEQEINGAGFSYGSIRLAEVYLIYAEAAFELSESISDEDLNRSINRIRDRVGMPHLTNAFVTTNGLDMRTEIRRERTIELVLEADRYDDLRRWKTAEIEMPMPITGVVRRGTQYETDERWKDLVYEMDERGAIIIEKNRIFDPNKHYLQPIPLRQRTLNPQLEQNPNW